MQGQRSHERRGKRGEIHVVWNNHSLIAGSKYIKSHAAGKRCYGISLSSLFILNDSREPKAFSQAPHVSLYSMVATPSQRERSQQQPRPAQVPLQRPCPRPAPTPNCFGGVPTPPAQAAPPSRTTDRYLVVDKEIPRRPQSTLQALFQPPHHRAKSTPSLTNGKGSTAHAPLLP